MMAKRSRIAILVASLALGLLYVLPVWTIDLEAPQYPEGIGMVIRLNTIEGQKEHDLKNINGLNHYIGMQAIEPDSIPELRLMPIIVAILIVTGLGVAALGRRRLLYAWTAAFLLISLVGLADFWKWEYDYGHNLDPTAAIQVPGMSYQPPLIGSRQILNFTAHSWPGAGGWIAILAAVTAVAVTGLEVRDRRRKAGQAAAVVLLLSLLGACAEPAPRPLEAGVDTCAHCLMVVDANGHGAEVVGRTGKVYTFDSVECMTSHLADLAAQEVHSAWVVDFSNPEDLVPAESAFYLVSETLTSPMGLGITAFGRAQDREGALHAFGGEAMSWDEVRDFVAAAWPDGRPPMPHGGHSSSMTPTHTSGG